MLPMSTELSKKLDGATLTFYTELRKKAYAQLEKEIRKRKETNSSFTPLEQKFGIYLEEIEPQVREAVIALNEKGYSTFTSGFDEDDPRYQMIGGTFRFDEKTKAALREMGAEVEDGP